MATAFRTLHASHARAFGARTVWTLLALLCASWGAAQVDREIGTITMEIGGRTVSWTLQATEYPDGSVSAAASWAPGMFGSGATVSIEATRGSSDGGPGGTLLASLEFLAALPSDCPCTVTHDMASGVLLEVTYVPESFGDGIYQNGDGGSFTWIFDLFAPLEDDDAAYRVEGTFEGTLAFAPSLGADPDPSNVEEVRGTIVIDALPEVPLF